jgi:hypothetical protein
MFLFPTKDAHLAGCYPISFAAVDKHGVVWRSRGNVRKGMLWKVDERLSKREKKELVFP